MIRPFLITPKVKLIENSFFEELRALAFIQQKQQESMKAMRELLDKCSYILRDSFGDRIRRLYETPANDQ